MGFSSACPLKLPRGEFPLTLSASCRERETLQQVEGQQGQGLLSVFTMEEIHLLLLLPLTVSIEEWSTSWLSWCTHTKVHYIRSCMMSLLLTFKVQRGSREIGDKNENYAISHSAPLNVGQT